MAAVKTRKKKVTAYTPEQKQAYKEQMLSEQKQLLQNALTTLTDSNQWNHWIKFGRNNLRRLTLNNALLIWSQDRNATVVWGRKQWEKKGVTVNPDAKGLRYFAPSGFFVYKDKDGNPLLDANGNQRRGMYYRVVVGYDITETDAKREDFIVDVALEGDEMIDKLDGLEQLAREVGYSVAYEDIKGDTKGFVDDRLWKIVVDKSLSGNDLVRVLLHEVMHVLGDVNYKDYSRAEAEVIVESATVMTLGMLGFDVSEASVPYIAAWGDGGETKTIEKYMKLVENLVNMVSEKMEG